MQTARFKLPDSLNSTEKNCDVANEYDKRIKVLEQEYVLMSKQRFSSEFLELLSSYEVSLEEVVDKIGGVVKNEVLREKEDYIKSLLEQVAYYKKLKQYSLNEGSLTLGQTNTSENKSAILLALEKSRQELQKSTDTITELENKMKMMTSNNDKLEQEVRELRKNIDNLEKTNAEYSRALQNINSVHSLELNRAITEGKEALAIQAKNKDSTNKVNKSHVEDMIKLRTKYEELIKMQQRDFALKLKESEDKLVQAQKEFDKKTKKLKGKVINKESAETKRLKEALCKIQEQYADIDNKYKKVIEENISKVQQYTNNKIKSEYKQKEENDKKECEKLKESFQKSLKVLEAELLNKTLMLNEKDKIIVELQKENTQLKKFINVENCKWKAISEQPRTQHTHKTNINKLKNQITNLKASLNETKVTFESFKQHIANNIFCIKNNLKKTRPNIMNIIEGKKDMTKLFSAIKNLGLTKAKLQEIRISVKSFLLKVREVLTNTLITMGHTNQQHINLITKRLRNERKMEKIKYEKEIREKEELIVRIRKDLELQRTIKSTENPFTINMKALNDSNTLKFY